MLNQCCCDFIIEGAHEQLNASNHLEYEDHHQSWQCGAWLRPRRKVKHVPDTGAFQIRETLEGLPERKIHDVNDLVIRDVLERLLVAIEMRRVVFELSTCSHMLTSSRALDGEDSILCFKKSRSAL